MYLKTAKIPKSRQTFSCATITYDNFRVFGGWAKIAYMSRIETGQANPTLTMIHALATSLAVTPGSLFDPAGDPPEEAVPAPRKPRPSRGRVR